MYIHTYANIYTAFQSKHVYLFSFTEGELVQMWGRTRRSVGLRKTDSVRRVMVICEQGWGLSEWCQLWETERSQYTGNTRPTSWWKCQNPILNCEMTYKLQLISSCIVGILLLLLLACTSCCCFFSAQTPSEMFSWFGVLGKSIFFHLSSQ